MKSTEKKTTTQTSTIQRTVKSSKNQQKLFVRTSVRAGGPPM